MTYNAYGFLVDFALASGFLLLGQLLRAKIKFFQQYFVPASLIAGLLGLLCGPNGLHLIPFSGQSGSYSGLLIILVFASIGIRGFNISTKGLKQDIERIGSYLCYRESSYIIQYTFPIIFSFYLLSKIYDNLHPGFGMILGAGFVGGHGTAAAVGTTFAKYGWADATDLGMTSATVGLMAGIFGGIILIKWATKKGITSYVHDFGTLPQELRTGLIPAEKRESVGQETISPISLDPLVWHLSLLLLPTGLGYLLTQYISKTWGLHVPSYSMGFLVAVAFYYFFNAVGVNKYIDRKVISRIGSGATDYLVFFGVSTIKIPIIIKYALPLTLLLIFGIALVVFAFMYLSPRMMKKDWFERGIFVYGYCTGVFAIGFALLRIVDPDMQSKTLDDTAIIQPFTSWIDIVMVSTGPILLSTGKLWGLLTPGLCWLVFLLVVSRVMKWWYPQLPLVRGKAPTDLGA